jgi:acetate kinase
MHIGLDDTMHILVINAGSSSLKLSLFSADAAGAAGSDSGNANSCDANSCELIWKAQIDGHAKESKLTQEVIGGAKHETVIDAGDDSVIALIESIWSGKDAILSTASDIQAVGHRVVHGGPKYASSVRIDDTVLADLRQYVDLAPVHESANIEAIELAMRSLKHAIHVAVFDTAFHHNMPLTSTVYAGPYAWFEQLGIHRYGFHGISHQYCAQKVIELMPQPSASRIITCHLGSGGSLCASLDGKSVMTTMGFTPLEGLVMRTRSGSIDPGLILHLLHKNIYSVEKLSTVLNEESGLLGLSGLSGDMREIEGEAASGNQRAKLAFDLYEQSLAASISSLVPVLGGLDALAFTGGIGENSAQVRSATCKRLRFLDLELDSESNNCRENDRSISSAKSKVATFVISAREDLAIAKECWQVIA